MHASHRDFYENLYQDNKKATNHAHEIYDRLRADYLKEMVENIPGPTLIVGCGSHLDFSIVSNNDLVFSFDLAYSAVEKAPKIANNHLFVSDTLDLPFKGSTFDLIICSEVLEHVHDIRTAVREFHRVIKDDGVLVVSSPNWMSWFGIARWIAEKVSGVPQHSSAQPYDDWKTMKKYALELSPEFSVVSKRGVWYLPPLHYRDRGLSKTATRIIYSLYSPLEKILSRRLPQFGHLILLKLNPNRNHVDIK